MENYFDDATVDVLRLLLPLAFLVGINQFPFSIVPTFSTKNNSLGLCLDFLQTFKTCLPAPPLSLGVCICVECPNMPIAVTARGLFTFFTFTLWLNKELVPYR